jgi:hypothetical protein
MRNIWLNGTKSGKYPICLVDTRIATVCLTKQLLSETLIQCNNIKNQIGILGCGIQGPLGTAAIVPDPGNYDDGVIGGMIGRGNRGTRRKPAPVPLCPPQTPHAARTRTRAAAVESKRLTA